MIDSLSEDYRASSNMRSYARRSCEKSNEATKESFRHHQATLQTRSLGMNALAWFALILFVVWLVLKLALAITSGLLHLVWLAAVVMLVMWLFNKVRGSKGA